MTADEKFFAWLDGELSGAEAEAMAERVAADPELARLAEEHKAMQSRLRAAFDLVSEMPVPDSVRRAVEPREAQVIDFGAVREKRRGWADFLWPQWTAMAATLALGLFIGTMVAAPDSPIEADDGRLYAAGALGEALDTQLARAPGGGEARVGLTFRDASGAICRSFTESQSAGLACRSGDRWQVRGLFASGGGETGEFRMASGMDPNLAALVESTMAGAPFDAEQEKAARAKGWR